MRIHFIGIGGSGISGVAKLAEKMGYSVTGCDLEASTAYVKNIFQGHSVDHLKKVDLVIVSPAVFYQTIKHPEILAAEEKGILMTWQEFLGKILLKDKKVICIAGTHGKSTTTAIAGKLLIDNGLDPIVVVGALVPEWGGNSRFGKGEYAVVEADEFNNNFLNYSPEIAVINNIEFDHPDFFKNEAEVQESFRKFVGNLVGPKVLITQKESLKKKFNLKILGLHNQQNANMVFVLGRVLGIDESKIVKSIESFKGIGRRLELLGERNGIKVYDDYAHHPTAIAATLEGLRSLYKDKKIWVVVEPHGFDRTHALLSKYKGVFDAADNVIIGPIFKARDIETFGITPDSVAKASGHKEIVGVDSFEEVKKIILSETKSGDVILVMGAGKSYLWAREILESLGNVSFRDLTTFRVGGKIKNYKEIKNKQELISAVTFAKENKLSIFVLGGGSDILVSDKDFNGLVIKYAGSGMSFVDNETVKVEAGESWDTFVEEVVELGLQGVECLSGIPGTVGASPIQNIGAYGQELKDSFENLTAYDIEKEKFIEFKKSDCEFGYRESSFKKKENWQKYVITDVTFKLNKDKGPEVKYDSLKNYIEEHSIKDPTLKQVREAVLDIRSGKFENPKEVGNAGSFFKNPIVSKEKKIELEEKYPDIKSFPFGEKYKLFAGWLVENAGWKGKVHKTAAVSPKHALILINPSGNAKAEDVIELSNKIIQDVDDKFGVKLEREVQLINFYHEV